ncbi:MAG: hypothetical protein H8D23_28105 [Candidatus Brocadiales bacterium]|nr:hypothetical protein [Candidatus Brocadiales bacterium]
MFLSEYLSDVTKTIDEYAKTSIILSSKVESDFRTERLGFIKGKIIFIDDSKLFFTEYLDLRYKIEKLTYSFHYQDKKANLIFRYDNAAHKPSQEFAEHKHVGDRISQSDVPELKCVLEEIIKEIEI